MKKEHSHFRKVSIYTFKAFHSQSKLVRCSPIQLLFFSLSSSLSSWQWISCTLQTQQCICRKKTTYNALRGRERAKYGSCCFGSHKIMALGWCCYKNCNSRKRTQAKRQLYMHMHTKNNIHSICSDCCFSSISLLLSLRSFIVFSASRVCLSTSGC